MKIALINPPWVCEGNTSGVRAGSRWPHIRRNYFRIFPFPYRLAESVSLLRREGHDAQLIDALAEGLTVEQTLARMGNCDIAVVETATNSLVNDIDFLKVVHERYPATQRVAVGQHAAIGSADLEPYCEYIFAQEYDYKLRNLARKQDIGDEPVDVLDIPWPYRDPRTMHLYQESFCTSFPNATVTTSRGCPYACAFCQEPTVFYKRPGRRLRDPKDVIDEWEYLQKEFKVKEIYIDDSTFNADEKFVNAWLDELERRKMKIKFSAMGDVRISNQLLERLAKNGFTGLKIGVESIHPEVMRSINKSWLKLDDARRVVRKCRELGIFIHGTFILGVPADTRETIRSTIDFAISEPFNFVQFSPFIPMPGTRIFDEVKEKGWLRMVDGSITNVTLERPDLPAAELEELVQWGRSRISKRVFTNVKLAWKYFQLGRVASDTNLFRLVWDRAWFALGKRLGFRKCEK